MKMLADRSFGWHNVRSYLNDGKRHATSNCQLFKKLNHMNNALYEIELTEEEIDHKEPFVVGILIHQYAKLRMWEPYYKFSLNFVSKQVRSVGDGYRFSVSCSCREGIGRLYPAGNETRVGTAAAVGLHRQFHCHFSVNFFPESALTSATNMTRENLTLRRRF